ncbi:MAG: SBBP repeat-containing protein [Ignavibacteria bacterium]|nr:SBBP repeat-containing protein [Ignavibacteria bacterium]
MKKISLCAGSMIICFLLNTVLFQNHCTAEINYTINSEKIYQSDGSFLCNPNYFPWTRQLHYGTRTDEGIKIKTDSCGNVYVAGNTDSTTSGLNNYNFLIIKYGPGGDTLWVRSYNGIDTTSIRNDLVSDMTIDASGNVYVTGRSMNKYGNFDYATVKFDTDGVLQWAKRFNAPYNDIDVPNAIAVDKSGNVFVTGQSRFNSANYQYVTIKYSSNGDSLWLRNYNGDGNSSSAIGLSVDDSGNCYVSGNSIRFAESWNFVTIKYNSSGSTQWTKMYKGSGANTQEVLAAMKMDNAGNIFLTGYSNMSSPNMDYLIVKYDRGGNYHWANTYNGTGNGDDYPLSLTTDQSGNVIVTGYSIGPGSNNYDIATVKYNSSGVQQWFQRFNGPGNYMDAGRDVKTDTSGNIYVAGNVYFGNYSDAVAIKYNPSGAQTGIRKFNGTADRDDLYYSISLDKFGNVHVTGGSKFNNFDYMFLTTKYPQNEFGSTLKLSAVLQGFHYSASTPFMRSDTVKVF